MDELAQNPTNKIKTLIEMPAYSILAPTNGSCHPSGRAYTRRSGRFSTIAKYSAEEREALIDLARGQAEMPLEEHEPFTTRKTDGDRPGDVFAHTNTWADILEPVGWKKLHTRNLTHWRRAGKNFGWSATTNYKGADLLHVFTSSTEFDADKSYGKFAAHAMIHHGGDFSKAAKELSKLQKTAKSNEDSAEPRPDGAPAKKPRIKLIPFNQIKLDTTYRRYLIKGVIPNTGLVVVWGPPKCGKSFWTYDAMMHVAPRLGVPRPARAEGCSGLLRL
jgi:hypothetical protein